MNCIDKTRARNWRRRVWRLFAKEGFRPAAIPAVMVMVAVDVVGTAPSVLSELTALSEDYVKKVLRRLRQQRILRGQTMQVAWDHKDHGWIGPILDGLVAAGDLVRPVNPKQSAAQKKRAPETRARGPRTRKAPIIIGPFTPKHVASNPLYGLAEWERNGDA